MAQKKQRPLLDERGMHITTMHGAGKYRGTCPHCQAKDRPLHRLSQREYVCAVCARKAEKKERGSD